MTTSKSMKRLTKWRSTSRPEDRRAGAKDTDLTADMHSDAVSNPLRSTRVLCCAVEMPYDDYHSGAGERRRGAPSRPRQCHAGA